MAVQVHPSAIVDAGAQLGDGTRVWHFVHVSAGARIGSAARATGSRDLSGRSTADPPLGRGVAILNDHAHR